MSNLVGDDQQLFQNEEDRQGELLCLKIKTHLEELFSDSHLAEDGFLLKHVQKNRQGFVSLKLLTCLKKIRTLTKNWNMTLAGAMYSDLLEVNDERTKVRRIEPLPKRLLCSPTSKLLLTWNISEEQSREGGAAQDPEHAALSERVLQKFSVHGKVTSVRILPPGRELPTNLQCYAKHHKELGQHLCAVVKFDNLELVRKVYSTLKAEEEKSNGKGMYVVPLGCQSMHCFTEDESSEEKSKGQLKEENPPEIPEDLTQQEHSSPITVSDKPRDTCQPKTCSGDSAQQTSDQIFTSSNIQTFPRWNHRDSMTRWCSGDNPWVHRRKLAAGASNFKVHLNTPRQRVLRQPFGPDGTRGFKRQREAPGTAQPPQDKVPFTDL
ncbi:la-related protein 6-like [Archocentrus centrarchus]|uniref:la-related protein 6-like n=1 Tax=Archocentrus centrarchus TaxID=63155 RepID=UPI0011EA0666|nr:la-related protein 6-like [Archocentrus centrarchus]